MISGNYHFEHPTVLSRFYFLVYCVILFIYFFCVDLLNIDQVIHPMRL